MILLDAYAARTCAVKTHHKFNPGAEPGQVDVDEHVQEIFDRGEQFEDEVVAELLAAAAGAVDLRSVADPADGAAQVRAAASTGAPLIIGAFLPLDAAGHRVGQVDVLVRAGTDSSGGATYRPVEVKGHRVLERRRPGQESPPAVLAPLSAPGAGTVEEERRFRYGSREADLVQLAHYWRMLEATGLAAAGDPWVGVIGTDPEARVVTWVRLDLPVSRTFSRTAEQGWVKRSILQRYDHEFSFRLDVARNALAQGDPEPPVPLVHPIRVDECRRCQWWELCREQMGEDDLSVKLDKGPLDVREISVLRRMGVRTVADLATRELAELLPPYLAEVRHRDNAEARLRTAHHRSVMMASGEVLERTTTGPISLPVAPVEIDFDLESSREQRIYLWGFLVNEAGTSRYVSFTAWDELDETAELALAEEALTWLREMITSRGATVHHYSGYEISQLVKFANAGSATAAWLRDHAAESFIDLYEVVKQHWFGLYGLGLKQVATSGAGFAWRDDDPSGLSSQTWFNDAVHAADPLDRAEARQRVLDYNEDDVIATREVRRWLREV